MQKTARISFIPLLIFMFLGCDNLPWAKSKKEPLSTRPPVKEQIVAKVGDFYITADDLDREIENFNALVASQGLEENKIETKAQKLTYLREDVVRKYMLYKDAMRRGLDKNRDIVKALEEAKISLLVAELLRKELEKIDVSSQEIEEFYNQNKDILKEPEQRRILEVVTDSEDEAKQVYIEILKGTNFSDLARQFSKAPTANKGGDVGLIANELDPKKRIRFDKFYEVAFSPTLESGGTSNIFKGQDGYYIIKVESIKKTEAKPLNELYDNIKSYLLFVKQQKAVADLADKLSGETKVEIFQNNIK